MPPTAPPPAAAAVATATSSFAIDVPAALLRRARAGEGRALEQLYRWFERPVFNLALRICHDREVAADVLQDTMLKVIGRIGDFRGDSPFWGWLRQIAVNEALMRLRRGRRLEAESDIDDHAIAGDVPPPSAAADAAALQRAMAELPEITRSVLWLYHAEGFTHDEIGALMARTPSFSKSQVARGTRRLRELLESPRTAPTRTTGTAP
ncbi:RNA polymerase sigma factor [Luteimonas abyssi]|uniref:RNA polymerase sigma factor n=1 Tax=Luteimonas abyssi TaxID=1247514 RepID=UPI000737C01F|nr:sigma-70 family RNA polymerase sigma factor [Luteimonas abyssi]